MSKKYDSTQDTLKHIARVRQLVDQVVQNLLDRSDEHDASKLQAPEKAAFDEFTPKLKATTYGSEEYAGFLAAMKPALKHHYENNSHHPEHWRYDECNGCFKRFPIGHLEACDVCGYNQTTERPDVNRMSLLDILEMLCDWKAASERHADGDLQKSIARNKGGFELSDQLTQILENTARELNWIEIGP